MHNFLIVLHHLIPLILTVIVISLFSITVGIVTAPTHDAEGRIIEATCFHYWRKSKWWQGKRGQPHPQFACLKCQETWRRRAPRPH